MSTDKKPFTYGMDPDDMPDTPENRRRLVGMQFNLWKHSGVRPEEIEDQEKSQAYATYLETGVVMATRS